LDFADFFRVVVAKNSWRFFACSDFLGAGGLIEFGDVNSNQCVLVVSCAGLG